MVKCWKGWQKLGRKNRLRLGMEVDSAPIWEFGGDV